MSWISIFENLRLSGKFLKKISPYISGYFLMFIFIFIAMVIVYAFGNNLMSGFLLFTSFPYWLRFVILDLISSALIAIPLGIIVGLMFAVGGDGFHNERLEYLESNFTIKCIECSTTIKPQSIGIDGQIDIRCQKCDALMTLTMEDGNFKKLTLNKSGNRGRTI